MQLETSATVLTCVQAAVDPLIYTLVTRQFRSELGKVLSSIPGCPRNPAPGDVTPENLGLCCTSGAARASGHPGVHGQRDSETSEEESQQM